MKEDSKDEEKDSMENVLGSDASSVLVSFLLEVIKLLHPSSHPALFQENEETIPEGEQDIAAGGSYFNICASIFSCLRIALVTILFCQFSVLIILLSSVPGFFASSLFFLVSMSFR
jgi:hypothetical protein